MLCFMLRVWWCREFMPCVWWGERGWGCSSACRAWLRHPRRSDPLALPRFPQPTHRPVLSRFGVWQSCLARVSWARAACRRRALRESVALGASLGAVLGGFGQGELLAAGFAEEVMTNILTLITITNITAVITPP